MIESLPLFVRDPVYLYDYAPKFSKQESSLFYNSQKIEGRYGRGIGFYDDEDGDERISFRHTITVNDVKLEYREHTGFDRIPGANDIFDAALEILSQAYAIKHFDISPRPYANSKNLEKATNWLNENFKDLRLSIGYWKAMERLSLIAKKQEALKKIEEEIRIGKIISYVEATAVKEGKLLTSSEFDLLCLEFGMLKSELDNSRRS